MSEQPNTSRWTFAKYVAEVYVPKKQADVGMTELTARWLVHWAAALRRWKGRPVRPQPARRAIGCWRKPRALAAPRTSLPRIPVTTRPRRF